MDTFGYFWSLEPMLDSFVNELKLSCVILHKKFFQLLIFDEFNEFNVFSVSSLIYFSLSVSVFCMSLSKHDVRCQVYMKEAVPSKEAAEASDERRREPFFCIEVSGCCE